MTLREEIVAKIDAIKAKSAADVSELEAHLAAGGTWLDQEYEALKAHIDAVVIKVRAAI